MQQARFATAIERHGRMRSLPGQNQATCFRNRGRLACGSGKHRKFSASTLAIKRVVSNFFCLFRPFVLS
jgi:hypothetical protein